MHAEALAVLTCADFARTDDAGLCPDAPRPFLSLSEGQSGGRSVEQSCVLKTFPAGRCARGRDFKPERSPRWVAHYHYEKDRRREKSRERKTRPVEKKFEMANCSTVKTIVKFTPARR